MWQKQFCSYLSRSNPFLQLVPSNEGKVSCSWKQLEPLMRFKLMTSLLGVRCSTRGHTAPLFVHGFEDCHIELWISVLYQLTVTMLYTKKSQLFMGHIRKPHHIACLWNTITTLCVCFIYLQEIVVKMKVVCPFFNSQAHKSSFDVI